MTAPRVDLLNLTDREHEIHLSGYLSGVLAGIDLGREQMDAELAALHRRAYTIVQAMAKVDPWEVAQEKIRQRRDEAAARNRAAGDPWPLEVPA